MNIPDEVIEAGWAASYAAPVSDAPKAFMQVIAEWARKEALREAADAISCEAHGGAADQCALCVNYTTVRALAEAYE